jgi:ammonia channel protein AmtB
MLNTGATGFMLLAASLVMLMTPGLDSFTEILPQSEIF